MTLVEQASALLAEKRRTHGGPTGLTTENEAGAYAAEQWGMWLCLNGERLVDALVAAERTSAVKDAAMRLYAARRERKRAREALVAFRQERGGCEVNDGGACFQYRMTGHEGMPPGPMDEWCDTCRDSQTFWVAYKKACHQQAAAIRSLMARCAKGKP